MIDRTGEDLGRYHLTRLLGSGGFASVYLGEHRDLHAQAAIKVMELPLTAQHDSAQFRQEAQTIANLIHPHIVRVLDFGNE